MKQNATCYCLVHIFPDETKYRNYLSCLQSHLLDSKKNLIAPPLKPIWLSFAQAWDSSSTQHIIATAINAFILGRILNRLNIAVVWKHFSIHPVTLASVVFLCDATLSNSLRVASQYVFVRAFSDSFWVCSQILSCFDGYATEKYQSQQQQQCLDLKKVTLFRTFQDKF